MVFLLHETPKSESNFLRFVLKDFFYNFCFTTSLGPLWPFITSSKKRANKLIPDYTNSMRFTQLLKNIESGYVSGQLKYQPKQCTIISEHPSKSVTKTCIKFHPSQNGINFVTHCHREGIYVCIYPSSKKSWSQKTQKSTPSIIPPGK